MTITTSKQLAESMYDWKRCTHEGIGLPGCPTCDPDKHRCLARVEYVRRAAVLALADRLEAEARALRGIGTPADDHAAGLLVEAIALLKETP